jgi:Fur family zinc uptake transcriptional regulator
MTTTIIAPFHGTHDHGNCLDEALRVAEENCRTQGRRLTAVRRQVLALVWQSHKPQRAYDVLKGLKAYGHRPAPPTAYRALEFLEQAGLIHRIESLNAYIGCADPASSHTSQFFICDECDAVAEIQDTALTRKLSKDAHELGFTPRNQTIEIRGLCRQCNEMDNPHGS